MSNETPKSATPEALALRDQLLACLNNSSVGSEFHLPAITALLAHLYLTDCQCAAFEMAREDDPKADPDEANDTGFEMALQSLADGAMNFSEEVATHIEFEYGGC